MYGGFEIDLVCVNVLKNWLMGMKVDDDRYGLVMGLRRIWVFVCCREWMSMVWWVYD